MGLVDYYQILIFLFQGLVVSSLILVLFHFRKVIGISLLYATIGMFQFLQCFLASTLYIELFEGMVISPGSTILFSVSLFIILLFYIKEDATVTRRLIYALVVANGVLVILFVLFRFSIDGGLVVNRFNYSIDFFNTNVLVMVFGTAMLFFDSVLVILIYEFISKFVTILFIRVGFTMIAVLCLDYIFFCVVTFWGSVNLEAVLISGLIAKATIGFYYTIIFSLYLKWFKEDEDSKGDLRFKDVFHMLTYRQKFEQAEKAIIVSKNRFQNLTEISPVGIFVLDKDGRTSFINEKLSSMAGVPVDKTRMNSWAKALHPDDSDLVAQNWNAIKKGEKIPSAEYRFLRSDGSVKWVLGQMIQEYNMQNQLIGYVGTVTDITELKLYEIELNKLKDRAEESDRLKSAFLANMSHEIRTPMNGILGFAELLKEPKLSGDEQELYVSLIEESGIRMLNILRDIVDISKIESGQIKVVYSEVNVNQQIAYLYQFFKPEAEGKKLDLNYTISLDDKDSVIRTDKEKFNAILTNLVKNALKYTPSGTINFGYQKEDGFLKFFVKDTGMGIDKDRQGVIFERFVQADVTNNYAIEGAGIGLSIAKAFTEILGGEIWLESEKGKGTAFYFTIPRVN